MPDVIDMTANPALEPLRAHWGGLKARSGAPELVEVRDVVYAPFSPSVWHSLDPDWGIYAPSGELVSAAAYRRGADGSLVGQSRVQTALPTACAAALDEVYVYAGPIIPHFGHFLCAGLARLWCLPLLGRVRRPKLLFHAHEAPQALFACHYVRACFEGLGLTPDDIAVFSEPVRIKRLIVPLPSFEEQHFVHGELKATLLRIGASLPRGRSHDRPIYLTKARLGAGLWNLEDEALIEAEMTAKGAEIVAPERLSFAEQVGLFEGRDGVFGLTGSALHTHLFASPTAPVTALSPFAALNTNFALFDTFSERRTSYVVPTRPSSIEDLAPDGPFRARVRIADLQGVAAAYAALV